MNIREHSARTVGRHFASLAQARLRILAGLGHRCYGIAMKVPHLLAVGAAAAAMIFAASGAEAQQRPIGGGMRNPLPTHGGGMHGRHRFFLPFFFVEQEGPVIIEREVVREVPVVVEPKPPPPPPREPYVIGKSYASLPSGCMKMIEDGASYYLCSGEWYRELGSDGAVKYKAVAKP